jgi:hypothetical protein
MHYLSRVEHMAVAPVRRLLSVCLFVSLPTVVIDTTGPLYLFSVSGYLGYHTAIVNPISRRSA